MQNSDVQLLQIKVVAPGRRCCRGELLLRYCSVRTVKVQYFALWWPCPQWELKHFVPVDPPLRRTSTSVNQVVILCRQQG